MDTTHPSLFEIFASLQGLLGYGAWLTGSRAEGHTLLLSGWNLGMDSHDCLSGSLPGVQRNLTPSA